MRTGARSWSLAVVGLLTLCAAASHADVISIEESQQRAAQAAAEKECAGKAAQSPCAIGKIKGTCVPASCSRSYSELVEGRAVRQTKVEPCTQCNATPPKPGDERASRCNASPIRRDAGGGAALAITIGLALGLARRRRERAAR
jgi:hypothetical protein